jgi:hypothetical protein
MAAELLLRAIAGTRNAMKTVTITFQRKERVTADDALAAIRVAAREVDGRVRIRQLPYRSAVRGVSLISLAADARKLDKVVQAMQNAPGITHVSEVLPHAPVHATLTR